MHTAVLAECFPVHVGVEDAIREVLAALHYALIFVRVAPDVCSLSGNQHQS